MNTVIKRMIGLMVLIGIQNAQAYFGEGVGQPTKTTIFSSVKSSFVKAIPLKEVDYLYYKYPYASVNYTKKNTESDYKKFDVSIRNIEDMDRVTCNLMHVQGRYPGAKHTHVDEKDITPQDKYICNRLSKTLDTFNKNNPQLRDESILYTIYRDVFDSKNFTSKISQKNAAGEFEEKEKVQGCYSGKAVEALLKNVKARDEVLQQVVNNESHAMLKPETEIAPMPVMMEAVTAIPSSDDMSNSDASFKPEAKIISESVVMPLPSNDETTGPNQTIGWGTWLTSFVW